VNRFQGQHALAATLSWERAPVVTLAATGAALLLYGLPGAAPWLEYEQRLASELWRIVTCHWVHSNFDHLFWSVGVFVVIGSLCERDHRGRFVLCLALTVAAIPLALWALTPEITAYGGLSGLDSALFVLAAVTLLRQQRRERDWAGTVAGGVLLLVFAAKSTYEFATGNTVFVGDQAGMTPVPLAHTVGAVLGALVGLGWPSNRPACKGVPSGWRWR